MAKRKAKQLELHRITYVEWTDAASFGGQWVEHDFQMDLVPVKSCGFLHESDEEKIVLRQSTTPDFMSELLVIPNAWIKKIMQK